MKILILGAGGFVGSHLQKYLKNKGEDVVTASMRDVDWLRNIPSGIQTIIHCVGKAHELGAKSPEGEYHRVNVGLAQQSFQYFVDSQAEKFIFLSSVAAVEEKKVDGMLTETHIPHPTTIYGRTKLEAEKWLLAQKIPAGKKIIILRPALIYGEGDKGNLQLFYSLISKGIPYPLGAFHNQRSFLSIDNLSWVIDAIVQRQNIASGIYNIVDDEPISTEDLVKIIAGVLGQKPKIWKVSPALIKGVARIGDVVGKLPLNSLRLAKLTSDYIVSNQKIKSELAIEKLPVKVKDGIAATIKSFAKA